LRKEIDEGGDRRGDAGDRTHATGNLFDVDAGISRCDGHGELTSDSDLECHIDPCEAARCGRLAAWGGVAGASLRVFLTLRPSGEELPGFLDAFGVEAENRGAAGRNGARQIALSH